MEAGMPRIGPRSQPPPTEPSSALQLYDPPGAPPPRPEGVALAFVRVLRPRQWVKNTACLSGLIFSGQLFNRAAEVAALGSAGMFCAAASAVYVFNDLCDRKSDRLNPRKARRPVASGALPVSVAAVGGLALAALGCGVGWLLGPACLVVLAL